jgi:tetratricopeptide (TPR) repeat protein
VQTAFTYRDKPLTAEQVARDAGVAFVLSGSVQAAGEQARIGVQLSGGTNAVMLWNETFTGDLNDLFVLQDRVAMRVANSLGREMVIAADREQGKLAENAESTELLLRARALTWQPGSVSKFEQLEEINRTVLAREPDNPTALMGLALTLVDRATWGFFTPKSVERQGELFAEAEKLAERAGETAPGTPNLLEVQGWAALFSRDFESAERTFNVLREQLPLAPFAYNALGVLASLRYQPTKALEFFDRTEELEPVPRDYVFANRTVPYLQLGEYEAAIENAERALAANPRADTVLPIAAIAHSLRGDSAAAASWAARAKAANVGMLDAMGFATGSEAYERWADAVVRPTWRKLGLPE